MSVRFVNIDRETPMMFPPDLREWLPENHLAYFIVDIIERLDLSGFKVNARGSGDEQYPPSMMLALLIYSYAAGIFSSRRIEASTYTDVAARYICGGAVHPDFSVICTFRRENGAAFEDVFTKVPGVAQELGHLKKVGNISVDGTKVKANASKHKAVSYRYAKEMREKLKEEVKHLVKKAEGEDSRGLETGLTVPGEIARREERIRKLEGAVQAIEERYEEVRKREEQEYERKAAEGQEKEERRGKQAGGKPPAAEPPGTMQFNFTDSESRIMKGGTGKQFEQGYNAQAAVDTGSMLIVGGYVTNHPNDKEELEEITGRADTEAYRVETVSADSGYYSAKAVKAVEREDGSGPRVYCATGRQPHHRTVEDLEEKETPPAEPEKEEAESAEPEGRGAAEGKEKKANARKEAEEAKKKMAERLKTAEGKAIYKKRKETVEPVFGIIKQAMGFRQFMVRGLRRVSAEWTLVTLAYNIKRLRVLAGGRTLSFSV
jgi:transposase